MNIPGLLLFPKLHIQMFSFEVETDLLVAKPVCAYLGPAENGLCTSECEPRYCVKGTHLLAYSQ